MKSKHIRSSEIVSKLERLVRELKRNPFEDTPFWEFIRKDSDGVICSIRFEHGRSIVERERAMHLVVVACRGLLPFAEGLSQQPGATLGSKDAVKRAREALDALAEAEAARLAA